MTLRFVDSEECRERVSNSASESSPSTAHYHETKSKSEGDLHGLEVKPIVDNDSDDSDPGIFRVKRPSSLKAEKRNLNAATSYKYSEQQVLSKFHL